MSGCQMTIAPQPAPANSSWASQEMPLPSISAVTRARIALRFQAAKSARTEIKGRARVYLDKPWQLDLIRNGFDASLMTPNQLIAFAQEILRQELSVQKVWRVPVRLINVRAAILAGRYNRRRFAGHNV